MLPSGGVRVVLRQRAITDHEQLHVVEQAGAGPETVTLVAVDLIERLTNIDPAPLQLHMHERQTVDQ